MGELGGSFCAVFLHKSLMNILQRIFTDHYEKIIYTLHPRKTEVENIDKMLGCGDPSFGGAMFDCPKCGKWKFVPFRCHSRFFLDDRALLDCLFHAVNSVVSRMFFKQNKSLNFTPGFIMVLHTFGRNLKWNPHIHCLISEGGYSDNGFWRNIHHFNYTFLRNAFRTALLNEMEHRIGPSFKTVKARCYREHKEGFYVYAKPNKCDPKTVIKYIGRYLVRLVIATLRIDQYDGDSVTFHYNRHEDDKYVEETVPVMEFIQRLIQHIPQKHYKMIRYGGLYARHRETDKKLHRAISREKHHIYRSFNQWRTAILSAFGYDPLKCECGTTMLFLELYFNHRRVSPEEMYEKAMSRSRGRRSSA